MEIENNILYDEYIKSKYDFLSPLGRGVKKKKKIYFISFFFLGG